MTIHVAPPPTAMPAVRGSEALRRLLAYTDVNTVLDIGSGAGEHARLMREAGKRVTTVSLEQPADIIEDYVVGRRIPSGFDAIWACHVLEHQPNVGRFLQRCYQDLRTDGLLAVTVPPHKPNIVGGHLATWNTGLLLYHLVLAGFDCSEARVSGCYSSGMQPDGTKYPPYNLSVIVRKRAAKLPVLRFDSGDIARLAHFFPCPVTDGFDGRLAPIRW